MWALLIMSIKGFQWQSATIITSWTKGIVFSSCFPHMLKRIHENGHWTRRDIEITWLMVQDKSLTPGITLDYEARSAPRSCCSNSAFLTHDKWRCLGAFEGIYKYVKWYVCINVWFSRRYLSCNTLYIQFVNSKIPFLSGTHSWSHTRIVSHKQTAASKPHP